MRNYIISKERIGAAFAQATGYERLTTLVRELRLDHAVRLLNEHPELTIEQICQARNEGVRPVKNVRNSIFSVRKV